MLTKLSETASFISLIQSNLLTRIVYTDNLTHFC